MELFHTPVAVFPISYFLYILYLKIAIFSNFDRSVNSDCRCYKHRKSLPVMGREIVFYVGASLFVPSVKPEAGYQANQCQEKYNQPQTNIACIARGGNSALRLKVNLNSGICNHGGHRPFSTR